MRLYRSERFAVYRTDPKHRTQSVASMHIVAYGEVRFTRMKVDPHKYHIINDPDDEALVLGFLNEAREDIDALIAAYVAMEEPYNADRL